MPTTTPEHDARIASMTFASVYPHYVAKVEQKGRTKDELHRVIEWLTGFDSKALQQQIKSGATFAEFFERATMNPNAHLITGTICGYRIEEIENPLTRKARYLDKLVDELAKGRAMERILRSSGEASAKPGGSGTKKAALRSPRASPSGSASAPASATKAPGAAPKLLSGGNPQIPKGDGDAPVQAYIAAMPGWKGDVGRQLDALVARAAPKARRAVRWNTPFYGVEGRGWFLSFHCITRYIKVTFHNGASLKPQPPIESKHPQVRYVHIHEGEKMDEAQLLSWIRQAAKLPGEECF